MELRVMMNCRTDNCEKRLNKNNSTGYCTVHFKDHRSPSPDSKPKCKMDQCENRLNKANTTGYCKTHLRHSPHIKQYKNLWTNQKRSGLSEDEYRKLLTQQEGKCASCGTCTPGGIGRFHTDHDHNCCSKNSCGKCIRGLLCAPCNFALGLLYDDPKRIRALLEYIENAQYIVKDQL